MTCENLIRSGLADVLVHGQHFIANPALTRCLAPRDALAAADPSPFQPGGACGHQGISPAFPPISDDASPIEVAAS